jgi:hypothetical protein
VETTAIDLRDGKPGKVRPELPEQQEPDAGSDTAGKKTC